MTMMTIVVTLSGPACQLYSEKYTTTLPQVLITVSPSRAGNSKVNLFHVGHVNVKPQARVYRGERCDELSLSSPEIEREGH